MNMNPNYKRLSTFSRVVWNQLTESEKENYYHGYGTSSFLEDCSKMLKLDLSTITLPEFESICENLSEVDIPVKPVKKNNHPIKPFCKECGEETDLICPDCGQVHVVYCDCVEYVTTKKFRTFLSVIRKVTEQLEQGELDESIDLLERARDVVEYDGDMDWVTWEDLYQEVKDYDK